MESFTVRPTFPWNGACGRGKTLPSEAAATAARGEVIEDIADTAESDVSRDLGLLIVSSVPALCSLPCSLLSRSNNAPKAEVACRCIHRLGVARRRTVAAAVVWRAEMRAAFYDFAWYFDFRLKRIVTRLLLAAARVVWDTARLLLVGLVSRCVPVGRPLPDVANHVIDAIAVRRKGEHRGSADEAVVAAVLVREIPLPRVGAMPSAGRKLVAPGEVGAVKAAARRVFPLGLGWQIPSRPFRVGERVSESDVHNGMIVKPVDIALGTVRMAPVRPLEQCPPLTPISEIDGMFRRSEDERTCENHMRQRVRVIPWIGSDFREGDMAGRLDERLELPVGDGRAVDPEAVDPDSMRGRFFGIVPVRPHPELAARDEDHGVAGRGVLCFAFFPNHILACAHMVLPIVPIDIAMKFRFPFIPVDSRRYWHDSPLTRSPLRRRASGRSRCCHRTENSGQSGYLRGGILTSRDSALRARSNNVGSHRMPRCQTA